MPVLWHSVLSCCLQYQLHIWVLVLVLAAPLLTRLPANAPYKTPEDDISIWALAIYVGNLEGIWPSPSVAIWWWIWSVVCLFWIKDSFLNCIYQSSWPLALEHFRSFLNEKHNCILEMSLFKRILFFSSGYFFQLFIRKKAYRDIWSIFLLHRG